MELLQSQADRLSGLIQKELESEEPNTAEEEEEFQGYMRGWVAEYQRLSSVGRIIKRSVRSIGDDPGIARRSSG